MTIIRFLKNWTLPVSIATGTVVYLIFAYTPTLDGIGTVMAPVLDAMLPLFMFLVLFVTFCKVNFRKLIPVRWHWWVALLQIVLIMLLTAGIIGFRLQEQSLILGEAMLTCIIAPCASAAAVVTQKLGGNLEEMTTYTFLSNFITALFIPLCFPIIDKGADIRFLEAFIKIFYQVVLVLLLPMLMAYIVKHGMKKFHRWITGVKDLSYYLWGCSLVIVSGTTVKNIVHADATGAFLVTIAIVSLLLCLVQFAAGRQIGRRFHSTINAGQALGQKNTAFAIWISYTYLNPLSSVGPGCYILWQNLINSLEIWIYRKRGVEKQA
ncbi:MAG TPA: transporter [Prevotella sp.]